MQISKQVVIGACAAMVVMVGVIAFLLGRESARHHTGAPAAAPLAAGGAGPAAEHGAGDPWADPAPATDLRGPAPLPALPPSAPPAPAGSPRAPAPAGGADETAQVHDYFLRVAELQAGPTGDPNELANKLLASSIGGDTSGLDQLESSMQRALDQAKAIAPPEPCAAYHETLVRSLGDSLTLLGQLKSGLSGKDTNALTALLPAAQAMQTQATQLESQEREIKRRYGL